MTDVSAAAPPTVEAEDGGREQRWPLPADEQSLLGLIHVCFDEYWDEIWFGIIMEGAAWEVAAPNPPKRISMYDGYATVDFGRWHFHLCIGEHQGSGPELGRIRKCARAELYRRIGGDGFPSSWGVRLFNGRDEQMMTLMCRIRSSPTTSKSATSPHGNSCSFGTDCGPTTWASTPTHSIAAGRVFGTDEPVQPPRPSPRRPLIRPGNPARARLDNVRC